MKLRSLGALLVAAALIAPTPASAADARPMPECVERLFYTYIREPDPWSPAECLPADGSRSTDARPLDELLGPIPCVAYSAVRVATGQSNEISCI